jgi:peptidyl-dipeptidase Dcp
MSNPFLAPSPLYLSAPPFDQVTEAHYLPAFEAGMREQAAEIRAIADRAGTPTFDDTIVALERSGALLGRVRRVFFNLVESTTSPALMALRAEIAPRLAKHADDIVLDAALFARIDALFQQRATLGLDPVSLRLLERYHLDFVRAGARLPEDDKQALRALNEEEARLITEFSDHLLADTNEGAVVVDDVRLLRGLADGDIDAAAVAARERGLEGKWVIPLVNTTGQPALASLEDRALRERIWRASVARGSHGGPHDTRAIVARLAQLRARRARLLGFASHAHFVLDDQMARTPAAALALLARVVPRALERARAELADLQAIVDREGGGFAIEPWDWDFYAEKVRRERYDLDEAAVRPYLELERVLVDGVFFAAHEMYGVDIRPCTDLPVYHPDVRTWEVFDRDGSTVGLIYTDCFARESKRGGAWMDSFVDQSELLGQRPVVLNVLNVAKPAAGQPALLSFEEVTTLFHEFGHALHGLFSRVRYPYMSGTNTPRDFVEFPSQFNENWALEPRVLARYARHHQTGAAMPDELVAKIRKSTTFNQGFATLEALESAIIDMAWHTLPADAPLQDPLAFEAAALAAHGIDLPQVPPRYHSAYFAHVWPGGYGAGYYAYLWTAVLGADSYAWFGEQGGMTAENGARFRERVLSRGGTMPADQLYMDFRGSEPRVEPLLEQRGLA